MLEGLHERLAGVIIERLRWQAFLARYDTADTLFYLDPPSYGCEDDYGPGMFSAEEFEEMAELLARLAGRFILSLNDHPDVRRISARSRSWTLPPTTAWPAEALRRPRR